MLHTGTWVLKNFRIKKRKRGISRNEHWDELDHDSNMVLIIEINEFESLKNIENYIKYY